MASSESPRTVKVRGRRRASASSRVRTAANRASASGSNGWRSPSRVRHAGSGSPSSRVRLFFSTTRPEFRRPSSSEIQRSNGPGPSTAAPMYPGAMPRLPSAWDAERRRQIDRTKTGVLLILVGTLIGWLPYIGVIGFIMIFVGAILVILGRKAFGAAHSRNVIISIVLVILGIIITVVAGV